MGGGVGAEVPAVLIAEDAPEVAAIIQMAIEDDFGIRAVVAEDGQQALTLARQLRPALVLLDVRLPGLSGLEVARLLKADPDTSAIVLVAVTSTPKYAALEAGCSAHLAKPFDLDALLRLVGKYLGLPTKTP